MLKIKDIMTSEVFVLHAAQTLELVRSLMRIKHVRHVPIVEPDNTFVGVSSHSPSICYLSRTRLIADKVVCPRPGCLRIADKPGCLSHTQGPPNQLKL